ncbi:MAG: thiamine diphosphokinase [Anaerolineae bacterium]|nr:thiamine diphosphokinase [Anaerolineae bacterium]
MEAQKPLRALIFANGDLNDGPMVRRVLESAPDAWVIAADGGARRAADLGCAVHTLIGDLDSLSKAEVRALERGGSAVHAYPPAKNETDLELALLHAAEHGADWIRVFSAVGDRLDQTLANVYLLALPGLAGVDARIVAGRQQAWLIKPGEMCIEGESGDTLSLIPISGAAHGVYTENLLYPLRDETLAFGPARGISNVFQASRARVCVREGILLAVHTIGRA